MNSDEHRKREETIQATIRHDSHLALGCGFAFALVVAVTLIVYVLVSS